VPWEGRHPQYSSVSRALGCEWGKYVRKATLSRRLGGGIQWKTAGARARPFAGHAAAMAARVVSVRDAAIKTGEACASKLQDGLTSTTHTIES
jgi:hypothetical protein